MKFSMILLAATASAVPLTTSTSTGGLLSGITGAATGLISGLTSTGGLLGGVTGTGGAASGVTGTVGAIVTTLTGQISQLTQLTQLPTCALTCVNSSAKKLGSGSLSVLQIGTLCGNVTGVLTNASTCLTACKLPVAQTTQVTSALKNVCALTASI